jgi:hypothetical protein
MGAGCGSPGGLLKAGIVTVRPRLDHPDDAAGLMPSRPTEQGLRYDHGKARLVAGTDTHDVDAGAAGGNGTSRAAALAPAAGGRLGVAARLRG